MFTILEMQKKLIDRTELKFRKLEENPNDDDNFDDGHSDGDKESEGGDVDDIDGNNNQILTTGAGIYRILST